MIKREGKDKLGEVEEWREGGEKENGKGRGR